MTGLLDEGAIIVPMLTPSHAVDLFLGDLSRKSKSKTGRTATSYARILDKFTDSLRPDQDVTDITPDDCRRFLDRYARKAPGYQANVFAILNSYLTWLYRQQRIRRNPLDFIPRPRKVAAADLDVVTISTTDVPRLLASCDTVSERNCLNILAYLGPRRNAVAGLRRSDYNRDEGLMRFREKGTKVIWKPVPDDLADVLNHSIDTGQLINAWQPDDPYLVPPEGPLQRSDRDDRVIWRIVKNVADGIGVEAHVHALRAAFACFYLEQGGDLLGLQELMGHASLETTRVYLRKLNKRRVMEPVRKLSWGASPTVLPARTPDGTPSGSVYIIAAGDFLRDGSAVKIGWTGDDEPAVRLAQIQKSHHEELTLIAAYPGTRADEGRAHAMFEADRIRGEWFRSTPRLREAVASLGEEHLIESSLFASGRFDSSLEVGAGGFEPPYAEFADEQTAHHQPSLDEALAERLRDQDPWVGPARSDTPQASSGGPLGQLATIGASPTRPGKAGRTQVRDADDEANAIAARGDETAASPRPPRESA